MTLYMINLGSGMFLKPVIVGDMPLEEAAALDPAYIVDPIPEGMVKPRWNGGQWEETLVEHEVVGIPCASIFTSEEIDALRNQLEMQDTVMQEVLFTILPGMLGGGSV